MWFKQIQVFQLSNSFNYSFDHVQQSLERFSFTPCLRSLPFSYGWISLWDEDDAPLAKSISNCIIFCAQIEEKILPASVIRKELAEKVKQIEPLENRKVGQKEKWSLKDEIVITLLPRAFSKLTRVYAYIDVKQHWLVLATANPKKTEQFLTLFKKSMGDEITSLDLKKLPPILTNWLKEKNYPTSFGVEKECVLQDPKQFNRIIRCKQQDLFSTSIQSLIKDGCDVKQLALSWQDQMNFILCDDFTLHGIRFQDVILEQTEEMEPETKEQQFEADFIIMQAVFSALIKKLLTLFKVSEAHTNKKTALV